MVPDHSSSPLRLMIATNRDIPGPTCQVPAQLLSFHRRGSQGLKEATSFKDRELLPPCHARASRCPFSESQGTCSLTQPLSSMALEIQLLSLRPGCHFLYSPSVLGSQWVLNARYCSHYVHCSQSRGCKLVAQRPDEACKKILACTVFKTFKINCQLLYEMI